MKKILYAVVVLFLPLAANAVVTGMADNTANLSRIAPQAIASDPCDGSILSVINRPSFGDTPCTVHEDMWLVEGGFTHFNYTDNGSGYAVPNLEMRYGLPYENEIGVRLPNYVTETADPRTAGSSAFSFSYKHELAHIEDGIFSVEAVATMPSGSAQFGNAKGGFILSGVFAYDITPEVAFSAMLGAGTQSQPSASGGGSYFTVNPFALLSWRPLTQWQFFGEVGGQSSMGPGQGAGMICDGGIQFMVTPEIEFDAEAGTKLTNQFAGLDNYVSAGFGILF